MLYLAGRVIDGMTKKCGGNYMKQFIRKAYIRLVYCQMNILKFNFTENTDKFAWEQDNEPDLLERILNKPSALRYGYDL